MKVASSRYIEKIRVTLKKLLDELQIRYSYASILAEDTYSKNFRIDKSGITAQEDRIFTKRGFVVRVQDDRGYGEYSFDSIDEKEIPVILDQIEKCIMPLAEGFDSVERKQAKEDNKNFFASTEYEIHPGVMGDQAILEYLLRIREKGLASNEKLLDMIVNCSWQEVHKLFLSKERELEQNILWTNGVIAALAMRGQEIKASFRPYSVLGGAELLSKMEADVEQVANTAAELLDSEPIAPGMYDCVCSPEVTGMIVHEAFGPGVEMDMFLKDRAMAKYEIGEYVASPIVTMHDGASVMKETGSYFFDDEGTLACDTVVIDKGILKQGICDRASAEALGCAPTGNGRRESFERKSYTRMTNTWFEPGNDRVEDMISSIQYGFLLEEPSSGMEDPKNWGIQCMVSIAREIKDGKLTGKIYSPIVLTGFVPDLLKSITMMGHEAVLCGSGMCGKGYKEWVKVSAGGPYMKAKIRLG